MLDCAIIGAGPAGITASLYLKRAGHMIALFEKNLIGGLVRNANLIENYPGFPQGISGEALCTILETQIEHHHIPISFESIEELLIQDAHFLLKSNKGRYVTKTILLSTGTISKPLNKNKYDTASKSLIFYDITTLISNIKENQICIILGGGDAAFDYALNLSQRKIKSKILFRSNKPTCLPLLLARTKQESNIEIISNADLKKITKQNLKTMKVTYDTTNGEYSLQSDFLLVAHGRTSNDILFSKYHEKDNIPGLYFAGDVQTGKYRQIGVAVGQGLLTAMKIDEYLREKI